MSEDYSSISCVMESMDDRDQQILIALCQDFEDNFQDDFVDFEHFIDYLSATSYIDEPSGSGDSDESEPQYEGEYVFDEDYV